MLSSGSKSGWINRRKFLCATVLLALTPLGIAQPKEKLRRIGFFSAFPRGDAGAGARLITAELEKLGWIEGRTITLLETRTSEGRNEQLPSLAGEVVALAPDVIAVWSAPATRALMRATATIPIVMVGVGDPVAYGIVRSYTNPGGNITGASYLVNETGRKTLELLKQVAPRIASVAVFVNPSNEGAAPYLREIRAAGPLLALRIHAVEVVKAKDFEAAFAAIRRERTESVLLAPEPLQRVHRVAVGRFAAEHRLPMAVVGDPRFLDAGGLVTYGPSLDQYPALAARYIDKILRGADPGKLAIEQPAKFTLGISLVSAKALELEIPASVLARADEVVR